MQDFAPGAAGVERRESALSLFVLANLNVNVAESTKERRKSCDRKYRLCLQKGVKQFTLTADVSCGASLASLRLVF